ncbi:MAG: FAD-dependent oxidoreductase [Burkholderiaceae bacterium]|nr:FAD-dependent oxidoreductase [Burkholderiaceae bacterium]
MKRRDFLRQGAAAGACAAGIFRMAVAAEPMPKVLVVGGGYGGATAAKYVRHWSAGRIEVTLVEPDDRFVSCPLSNLVLGGSRRIEDLAMDRRGLERHGVRIVADRVASIDPGRRAAVLAGGGSLPYDRLVLSPGVDFIWNELPGLQAPAAREGILHAWKAGWQTQALRAQLESMADGGTFVLTVPPAPYRCPPGPYERACQVAHYFSREKPRSRVLVLDANPDVVSKGALFKRVWKERYGGIVEYRPRFHTVDVEPGAKAAISELGDRVAGDVLNVIPPQRAGDVARQAGLATANGRWCPVDFLTFESTQAPNVHVIGDAIQTAPLMPKSAHMANQHAKVCAAAVVDLLSGAAPQARPMLTNTCYSFVSDTDVIHVASVHAYDEARATFLAVRGSGGLSAEPSELEGRYAHSWAANIWADTLG